MKEQPKLKIDASYHIAEIIKHAWEEYAKRSHNFLYMSCLNCDHFNEEKELCKLVNQRPPARVIAFGCKAWQDIDEIPF